MPLNSVFPPQIDRKKLKKAILTVLFNQFVVSPPIMYIFYNMMVIRGCKFGLEIPTFHWALFELTVYVLIEELMFYYSHRLDNNLITYLYTLIKIIRNFILALT